MPSIIRRSYADVGAMRKKRPDVDIETMIYHQDNAPPHKANDTLMTIDFLGFQRLEHSPYSPDLAPMDFAVFPRLKAELRGHHFQDSHELRIAVRRAISHFEADWYQQIYLKWVDRHEKCIRANGDYFEKL